MLRDHRWVAKATAQKVLSYPSLLPIYHKLQQFSGRLKNFHPADRVQYAAKLATDIGLERVKDADIVEIGTGWVPVVPMVLHLMGAKSIQSFDLNKHLQDNLTIECLKKLNECFGELAKRCAADMDTSLEWWKKWMTLRATCDHFGYNAIFKRMNFTYHAPVDFTESPIHSESVDIVYSNLVLEHVTPDALVDILDESHRILRPGGVAWHNIDFTDHYAATHKGMTHVNFLRYSDKFWNKVGQNDILYQNRLRRSDYLKAFTKAGFEIENIHDHWSPVNLHGVPLAPRFKFSEKGDISCTSSRIVLKKCLNKVIDII